MDRSELSPSGFNVLWYSSVACFVTRYQYRFGVRTTADDMPASQLGDIDSDAIWPIISSAGLLFLQLMQYSMTVCQLQARVVLIWWSAIVWAGIICTVKPQVTDYDVYTVMTKTTCFTTFNPSHCLPTHSLLSKPLYSLDYWEACHCLSTCSELNGPSAPFRTGSGMVPYLFSFRDPSYLHTQRRIFYVIVVGWSLLCWNLIFCLLAGFLKEEWSQKKASIELFNFLYSQGSFTTSVTWRRLRFWIAKWITLANHFIVLAASCFAWPVFVLNVVVNENWLNNIPFSEPARTVGQWAPWASLALGVIGAIIRYYDRRATTRSLWEYACSLLRIYLRLRSTRALGPAGFSALLRSSLGFIMRQARYLLMIIWVPGVVETQRLMEEIDALNPQLHHPLACTAPV